MVSAITPSGCRSWPATYEISVADRGQGEANVVLTLQLFPAPPNDNFADRAALSTGTPVFGWTLGATSEPNEQQAFRGPSVWWQCGTDYYGVEFTTAPNATYRIAVASYFPILEFPFELHFYPSPANDFFANRSSIIGAPAQISTSFLGATPEPGTQSENGVDLWWTWRAPASGVARLAWVQSEYTPVLFDVYSGSSASNLALLAQAYNELSFPVAPGRSYEFRVSAWSGETNLIFALGFSPQPSPSLGNVGSDAGHFSFDLYGLSGQALRLETSTNLMDWESIGLHTLYGSRDRFTDPNALSPARFYRASPMLK